MVTFIYFLLYLFIFIFGICIGSFLNVVIYRLPRKIMLSSVRSYCPSCKSTIKNYDLIPLFSFLILKGRCRVCKNKISKRYPLVELLVGLIAVLMFYRFYFTAKAFWAFAFCCLLVCISLMEMDKNKVPLLIYILTFFISVISVFVFRDISLSSRIYALIVPAVVSVVFLIIKKKSSFNTFLSLNFIALFCGIKIFTVFILFALILILVFFLISKVYKRASFRSMICNILYIDFALALIYGDKILSNFRI